MNELMPYHGAQSSWTNCLSSAI